MANKINEELLLKFSSFREFMQTPKYTSSPIIVKDKRPQHETSVSIQPLFWRFER